MKGELELGEAGGVCTLLALEGHFTPQECNVPGALRVQKRIG